MSETVKSFIGRVAVVEQEGSAVRVLLNEGETMYAARDLLAACGCAYREAGEAAVSGQREDGRSIPPVCADVLCD